MNASASAIAALTTARWPLVVAVATMIAGVIGGYTWLRVRDNRFLYFVSDRGGSLNLWRIAIDEHTGKAAGDAVAITAPAAYAGHVSISADGGSIAYTSFAESARIQRASFDPIRARVTSTPTDVHTGFQMFTSASVSPDGAYLAFVSGGGGYGHSTAVQLDLWISRSDGTELRQLTNAPARDQRPQWSPDGQRIAFLRFCRTGAVPRNYGRFIPTAAISRN